MELMEALINVIREKIEQGKLKITKISEDAGFHKNFLTRVFKGTKPDITVIELQAISKALGINMIDLLLEAEQKKTA